MSYSVPANSWSAVMVNPPLTTLGSPVLVGSNATISAANVVSPTTFNLPVTTSPDTFVTNNDTATLTLKTIQADTNTLSGVWTSPVTQRYGEAQPFLTGAANTGLTTLLYGGALNGYLYYSTNITFALTFDNVEGLCNTQAVTAVSGQGTGILAPTNATGLCRRAFSGRMRARYKVSTLSSNFYFGVTSNNTMPLTTTPLGNGDSGIMVGFRNTDTNFQVFNNDGSGAEVVTQVGGPIAIDTNFHTVELNWTAAGNVNAGVDGTFVTVSTRLPTANLPLYANFTAATSTSTALTTTIHGVQVEFGK